MSAAEWRERMGPLGFGAAQLGNLFRETTDDEAAAAVEAAWEDGVRYFDTAPHYGLGLSERRLGAALASRSRDEFVLSTKVGKVFEPNLGFSGELDDEGFAVPATLRRRWDFSRDGIFRSLESSLERLGTERVDVVYLHDPDDHWDSASTTGVDALVELRDQGAIGAVGVGMNQAAMPAKFIRETDIDLVMLAGRYSLLDRSGVEELLPLALERGVGIVAAGVYNSGLLSSPKPRSDAHFDYDDAPAGLVATAREMANACNAHGVELPAAAIQFPLRHPAVVNVVVGSRTASQQHSNSERMRQHLPEVLWAELDTIAQRP